MAELAREWRHHRTVKLQRTMIDAADGKRWKTERTAVDAELVQLLDGLKLVKLLLLLYSGCRLHVVLPAGPGQHAQLETVQYALFFTRNELVRARSSVAVGSACQYNGADSNCRGQEICKQRKMTASMHSAIDKGNESDVVVCRHSTKTGGSGVA